MKLFSVPALLAAALLGALVGLPFLPIAQNESGPFYFEVEVTSTKSGAAQLYVDNGAGFNEATSSRADIQASTAPRRYRLGFGPGTYRAFRFDPLDRSASMTIGTARVVSASGRVLREFKPADFKPVNQISRYQLSGPRGEITMPPNVDDPELLLECSAPLTAARNFADVVATVPLISWITFGIVVLALIAGDRAGPVRNWARSRVDTVVARPKTAIAVVALVAVVLSTYPVVFLGKSFVSPNHGTILLYDAYPALPGYDNHEVTDVQLSDVGAIMWQHVPFSTIQHRALLQGELPLWNRYTSTGAPLLGQGQSMFGDPLHLLVIAANGASWAWDLKYIIAKWLFALGLGLLVLRATQNANAGADTHSERTPAVVAVLVTAVVPFIGFFLYRLNHPAFFSLCYAPWPLFFWLRIAKSEVRRDLVWSAAGMIVANIALMASGTAKEAYMLLLTMNLAGFCVLVGSALSWTQKLARFAVACWAGVIFALLTAPLWATFVHTLHNAYTSYNAASAFQLQPAMLLGLFDEIFFRPLMPNNRLLDPSLNFILLLGFLYFLATLRANLANRTAIALAIASLLPLSLAFGLIPPQWIVRWPLLGNVAHLDNTFSCALIVLWTVLAGFGFVQAGRRLRTPEARGDLVIVALLLGALVFNWIAFRQVAHRPVLGPTTFSVHKPGETLAIAPFIWGDLAALLIASVILLWLARRTALRGVLTPPAAILAVCCVTVLLWRHALHSPSVGFRGFVQQPSERVNFRAKSEAVSFVRSEVRREPARGFGLHGNFFPGWTAVYGLETVHGPDAVMSPYLRELVEASGIERLWDWRLYVDPEKAGAARPFLDALNVRWYFDLASDQGLLGKSLKLARAADLDVYESPTAWPRAFFTDAVFEYDNPGELVQRLRSSTGKPVAGIQKNDVSAVAAVRGLAPTRTGATSQPATDYTLTENSTSFRIHADRPGIVVLNEGWWPGDFRATLNGKRVPIFRVNHAFKAVTIPAAGDYEVHFWYWPRRFHHSLIASAIGALLLGVSLWASVQIRRPRANSFLRPTHATIQPP